MCTNYEKKGYECDCGATGFGGDHCEVDADGVSSSPWYVQGAPKAPVPAPKEKKKQRKPKTKDFGSFAKQERQKAETKPETQTAEETDSPSAASSEEAEGGSGARPAASRDLPTPSEPPFKFGPEADDRLPAPPNSAGSGVEQSS